MKEVCISCEHFVQMSITSTEHLWGDCRKPASGTEQITGHREAVFRWANATCTDFKPKREARMKPDETIL